MTINSHYSQQSTIQMFDDPEFRFYTIMLGLGILGAALQVNFFILIIVAVVIGIRGQYIIQQNGD